MGKIIQTYSAYEISASVPAALAGGFLLQITPPDSPAPSPERNRIVGLTRLRVILSSAVTSHFGLVKTAARGTAIPADVKSGKLVSTGNGGYSGGTGTVGQIVTGWTVAPTSVGDYYRREILAGAVGDAFEWNWPEDDPFGGEILSIPSPMSFNFNGILLQNIGAGASASLEVSARWIEFSSRQL
jgi:hypothetical protein